MVKADHRTKFVFPNWWVVFPLRNKTISTDVFLMSNFLKPYQTEFNSIKETKYRICQTRISYIQNMDNFQYCPLSVFNEILCGFEEVVHTILDSLSTDKISKARLKAVSQMTFMVFLLF